MGDNPKPSGFDDVVLQSREQRAEVRKLVRAGRWREAERNPERRRAFSARQAKRAPRRGAESIQGDTDDLQEACYLAEGTQISRAIAYVEVNDVRGSTVGTGFLVSPRLFLTNCHVIRDAQAARAAQLTFDREMGPDGRARPNTTYLLDPDELALFSTEDVLDYALIAVGKLNSGSADLADLGFCPLSDTPGRHVVGMNVNIIQHPRGLPKMIAIRNNILTFRTDKTLLYETDTDQGSSGSPVFNDTWDVVALHHWGEPFLERADENGVALPLTVNEGVRISAIYKNLLEHRDRLSGAKRALLEEALAYADQPPPSGKTLSPPRPHHNPPGMAEHLIVAQPQQGNTLMSEDNELRLVIPVEITVRIGSPGSTSGITVPKPSPDVQRTLTKGPESLKVDADYSNRDGYVPTFIPDYTIPLPQPNEKLSKLVAPLRAGEPSAEGGVLKYQHFSVVMNKSKRLAMFTATNIHGETYLTVDRDTGKVVSGAEGETWFKDSRISESFWTGQSFYSEWSIYFDRGHLTRRTDPTWGSVEEAERANADTYHFTNCSPQHFRFNQTTRYWQGAERYVLENGLLAADKGKPIIVFQGPIFDDKIDQYAGDVQIPSSFFKIIVWKGETRLKSVGLVVDQLTLLSEKRTKLGGPKATDSVDVSQWRVPISRIEDRTGLSFGELVRDADTIKQSDQPNVGAEAVVPIRSFSDIVL